MIGPAASVCSFLTNHHTHLH